MSRTESDREDLMREATALRIRGEFRIPTCDESVIAGCRDDGGWSVYFGQNCCFHLDAAGRVRRAYIESRLYRSQGTTLAELQRVRSDSATHLLRRDLEKQELKSFLNDMQTRLATLLDDLQTGAATQVRVVPEGADVAGALTRFLIRIIDAPPALAPACRTRPR